MNINLGNYAGAKCENDAQDAVQKYDQIFCKTIVVEYVVILVLGKTHVLCILLTKKHCDSLEGHTET